MRLCCLRCVDCAFVRDIVLCVIDYDLSVICRHLQRKLKLWGGQLKLECRHCKLLGKMVCLPFLSSLVTCDVCLKRLDLMLMCSSLC
jgi:hypothetical protein